MRTIFSAVLSVTMGAVVCAAGAPAWASGQAAAQPGAPVAASGAGAVVDASVCDVTGHPAKFDGKTVRLSGIVQVGVDSFLMRGESCGDGLWLSYPAGTKAKSGPATVVILQMAANGTGTPGTVRPPVALQANADFDNFDKLLSDKVKTPGMCLGCVKNNVKATLVGRIDGTANPGITRDASGKITALDGFGNMNQYGARMVIESVSNVVAEPIDFSKAPKISGDNQGSGDKNYLGLLEKSEAAYPKGAPSIVQIQKAIDAYGKPGVDNGVTVAFGDTADVPAGEGTKAAQSAPGGLLVTVRFDPAKLKGQSLALAAAHDGSEIDALRGTETQSLAELERKSWQMILLVTIGSRQKSLTLPGGTVLWSEAWPAADRGPTAETTMQQYLIDHEELSR